MRFLVRLIGSLLLAIAVVFAVGDIARSLADQVTHLVSVREALAMMGGSLEPSGVQSATVAAMLAEIGRWSVSITAGVAGLVLLFAGRERKRRRRLVR
ncbi:MAG TPA: hypothetical protein VIN77_00620 [Aurantimonas sp.]